MKTTDDVKKKKKRDNETLDDEQEELIMTEITPPEKAQTETNFIESTNERKEIKEPSDKVRVNFGKFVQMVATHNFEEVMNKMDKEEIVVSTDLLTELANAHDETPQDDRKLPVLMIAAFIIGVVITWLVIKY